MSAEIDSVHRAMTTLEKNIQDQLGQVRRELQNHSTIPQDVATLKASSTHISKAIERIEEDVAEHAKLFREEVSLLRQRAENGNTISVDRYDALSKSISQAADRIEQKFGGKIEDIRKELNVLVSDYDKRIAAMKAVAAAISVAFVVLQGVIGFAISSYVNSWKTRIEESEQSVKDLRKAQNSNEILIKELQQESLRH